MGSSTPTKRIISDMNWGEACYRLLLGDHIKRLEWLDDGTYLVMHEEKLMMYKPKDRMLHPLTVTAGDMSGEDWIIVPKARLFVVLPDTQED